MICKCASSKSAKYLLQTGPSGCILEDKAELGAGRYPPRERAVSDAFKLIPDSERWNLHAPTWSRNLCQKQPKGG